MSDNLYFIPIIARALQEPDIKNALRDAFREIKKKGTQKRFAEGFKNFKLFMDAVYSRHEVVTNDYIHELIAELATGTFEGTAQEMKSLLDIINSHPEWQAEYETICRKQIPEDLVRDSFLTIQVLSNKGLVGEMCFEKVPGRESIDAIFPGNYILKLVNTGWIIWRGELNAQKLIWTEAYGAKDLDLAAKTEDTQRKPTSETDLLNNGELMLRTYAGPESGSIEIELTR